MIPPLPKSSLETAYRLVADIAELFLIYNNPLHQHKGSFPYPTPDKCQVQLSLESLTVGGEAYKPDPNNCSVVPSDLLDRLADAISDLEQLEEEAWKNYQ